MVHSTCYIGVVLVSGSWPRFFVSIRLIRLQSSPPAPPQRTYATKIDKQINKYMCADIHISTHVTYVYIYTYTHMCLSVYLSFVCMCMCICIYVYRLNHACIHTYIHTYVHAYIHTDTYILGSAWHGIQPNQNSIIAAHARISTHRITAQDREEVRV